MLAAFQQYGLHPGPLLFQSNPNLVWGLIASLYIGNVMLLILNLPLAGIWVRLLAIPQPYLYAGILVFASLGVYSLHGSVFDLGTLCLFGFLGYAMRCADIPVSPAILGLILGPLAEQQFRRAMAISQGDPTVFLTRPISATILAVAVAALDRPALVRVLHLAAAGWDCLGSEIRMSNAKGAVREARPDSDRTGPGPTEVRVVSATGVCGSGFKEASLQAGMARRPHFIGCDAGSTDPGPAPLGAGTTAFPLRSIKRDLRLMLEAALKARIPLLVGSAGTAGGEPHLGVQSRSVVTLS